MTPAGYYQHVLNRGNEKATVFHKPADYEAFLSIIADGLEHERPEILAVGLMPNHFHLVMRPNTDEEIPAYMQWVMNVHVRRYREHYCSVGRGHVYQGRYKNFIIEDTLHLLTVLRYVEANPVRAKLVRRAEDWPWSSLSRATTLDGRPIVTPWPFERPGNWVDIVNEPFSIEALEQVRRSARRCTPFGTPEWTDNVARELGLEWTLRPSHRPGTQQPAAQPATSVERTQFVQVGVPPVIFE